MSTQTSLPVREAVIYPDSDGEPMSDNTLQFEWITTIKWGLEALFRDDPNVFVAGDLLWYPVEGNNTIRLAPDAMVARGRPKGYRGSYQQWREDGIAPQVVFEIHSPGNRLGKLVQKFRFYERYGVEEYYFYNPEDNEFTGWFRTATGLDEIPVTDGWVSPRLATRFELGGGTLRIVGPDGRPFATYMELLQQRDDLEKERDAERLRVEKLMAQLRELGVEPER